VSTRVQSREAAAEWRRHFAARPCVMYRESPCDQEGTFRNFGHHVLSQQALKRRHLHGLLFDRRNGIALCSRHHRRHEAAVERIPRDRLPPEALEFAERLGLGWWIEQRYPKRAT
jgi:hypothetical protein